MTHVRESFNQGNMEITSNSRDPLLQIILKEILKLSSKLNTCRTTANYNLEIVSKNSISHKNVPGQNICPPCEADVLSLLEFDL